MQHTCLHENTNKVPIMSQIEGEKGLTHKNISSQLGKLYHRETSVLEGHLLTAS